MILLIIPMLVRAVYGEVVFLRNKERDPVLHLFNVAPAVLGLFSYWSMYIITTRVAYSCLLVSFCTSCYISSSIYGDSITIFIAPSNPRVLYNPTENSRQVTVAFRTVAIILLAVTVILALFK